MSENGNQVPALVYSFNLAEINKMEPQEHTALKLQRKFCVYVLQKPREPETPFNMSILRSQVHFLIV